MRVISAKTLRVFAATLCTVAAVGGASFVARAQTPPYRIESNEVKLNAPVVFESASDKLKPESDAPLEVVRGYLAQRDYITLRIEGHTDSDGDAKANQLLSEKRALSVAKWLVGKGIDCKRVVPVGFGGTKPIAANDSPSNKALNRRIAFVNAALRGHAIGGMPLDGNGHAAGDPCAK